MTLTDFLLSRIAEDEAVAREADRYYTNGGGLRYEETGYNMTPDLTIDPARVLAECKAKWAIRSEHLPTAYRNTRTGETDEYCPTCVTPEAPTHSYPCQTIRHLAAVYADHPDYREEWKP